MAAHPQLLNNSNKVSPGPGHYDTNNSGFVKNRGGIANKLKH